MHIKLLKPVIVDSRHIAVGEVAEVDYITGMYLVRRGQAVEVKAPDEKPAQKRKRSRGK